MKTITLLNSRGNYPITTENRKRMQLFDWRILTILFLLWAATPSIGQYVHTDGTQIRDEDNNPIYMRGMNLGNWLLWEGYLMMGDFDYRTHTQFFNEVKDAFGGNLGQAIEFEHQWRLNYVNEQAIIDLKNLGFNSVRVPFHFNLFWDYGSYSVNNRGFQYLDRVINWCRANDMYVLLDMHAAPGYQNPGDHSDNVNSNASQPRSSVGFWDGDNINIASQVWQHIANYYKNEPVVWGYDLINEPVPQSGREYELLPSLIAMRNAIRSVDNNHIIVAEGSWWGSDMQKLDWQDPSVQSNSGVNYRWDNNLVYQTHHYSNDVSLLNGRKALTDRLNIPLMLGEYGENTDQLLRDMTDWCINNDVAYFPWSFKKMYHDRCIWTIHPNGAYNAVRDFIKNGGSPPANAYNNMISFCQNNIGNGVPGFSFHQGFYDAVKYTGSTTTSGAPVGHTIWLKANNGQYVSSENGQSPMNANRGSVGGWEQFTVEAVGSDQVAFKGSNGMYVNSQNGQSGMTCNSSAVAGWEAFYWEDLGNNTVALRGFGDQYVSSENGQSAMMCNRSSIGGWEMFTWGTGTGSRIANMISDIEQKGVLIYPNPINDTFRVNLRDFGMEEATLTLSNLSGQKIYTMLINGSTSISRSEIIKGGVYLISITEGDISMTRKVIFE